MSQHLNLLIVGAGELGEAILSALASHPSTNSTNTSLHVLLRKESIDSPSSPSKQASNERLRSLGATLVPGNFVHDPVSHLASIFKSYDVVIQAGGYGLPKGTQIKSASAALQAGVRRYFPWQFGVDYEAIGPGSAQDLFDEMLQVRKLLRAQSNTKWTIISTGLFMSYLFLPEFGVVDLENKTVRALGSWQNKITVTTPHDIGRMTAEMVFVAPEGGRTVVDERVVYIGGETISYGQLADLLDDIFSRSEGEEGEEGEHFKREEWTLSHLCEKLAKDPGNLWYKYQCIFGDGKGIAWGLDTTFNGQRGMEMTTVRDYILTTYKH